MPEKVHHLLSLYYLVVLVQILYHEEFRHRQVLFYILSLHYFT